MISTHQLTKNYGPRVGVAELDLAVPEGSVFGFLGPNGAGKTTTIRLLLGFLNADHGEAQILGHDCWRESHTIKEQVGYLPGDLRLYSWMTGHDALLTVSRVRGMDVRPSGRDLAEHLDLDLAVHVRSMSRGMRQKLGLILALAHDPTLIILDEPTASLDPLTQDRLYQHLLHLAGRGRTVFFSSHVLSEVEELCDRIAIVREGRLVANESLSEMRQRATRTVTLVWRAKDTDLQVPAILKVHERQERTWKGELLGSVPELLAWLSGKPLEDLIISPPDLDSLFRRYYQEAP